MAEEVAQPHDNLFRAVFGESAEAAGLLRAHLPQAVANGLQWSTLTVEESDFVDPELRATESDLLYSIQRRTGAPAWLYVLLEHQSTADSKERWMRLRLLRYCCRIWERDRRRHPKETELRPIVPVVFYQGRRGWRHAADFTELFAEAVREWPWLPHFEHLLIDQSEVEPAAVRGELQGRIAQLMMMAAYRRHWREALRAAFQGLAELLRDGGDDVVVRRFLSYALATQDAEKLALFSEELRRNVPGPGGDVMTIAESFIQQGIEQVSSRYRAGYRAGYRARYRTGTCRRTRATVPLGGAQVRRGNSVAPGCHAGSHGRFGALGSGRRLDHRVSYGDRVARPRPRRNPLRLKSSGAAGREYVSAFGVVVVRWCLVHDRCRWAS